MSNAEIISGAATPQRPGAPSTDPAPAAPGPVRPAEASRPAEALRAALAPRPAPAASSVTPLPLAEAGQTRPGAAARPVPAAVPDPAAGPSLAAFRSGGADHRLRDLLAFAMATEAGRPLPADGVETLRRQADAELEAYAFRTLHNRVEAIRREAMDEQVARLRPTTGFLGLLLANLLATCIVAGVILAGLAWWLGPTILTRS